MVKRLSWRCRDARQQKDKATIYNSREWRELRIAKLRANPLCEMCEAEGIVRSAHCVHHTHPIEDSTSMEEMRKWAFMWSNLVSLCDECHTRIHKDAKSHTREAVKQREADRHERWKDRMLTRFGCPPHNQNPGEVD